MGWKKYGNRFLNVVIPLENVYLKNGCLYLSSKKFTLNYLGKSWTQIANNLIENKSVLQKKFKFKPYPINIGDLLIFDWKVCHYSKKNLSKSSILIFLSRKCLNILSYPKNTSSAPSPHNKTLDDFFMNLLK